MVRHISNLLVVIVLVAALTTRVRASCDEYHRSDTGNEVDDELCTMPPRVASPAIATLTADDTTLPPAWWSWQLVAEQLSGPFVGGTSLTATKISIAPDIWQVDGLLDDSTCIALMAHHAAMIADRDTQPSYCFSRALFTDTEWSTITTAYGITNTDVTTSPTLWCVTGTAAVAFTQPPVKPPVAGSSDAALLSFAVSRSTLTRRGENALVDGIEATLEAVLGLPPAHAYHTQLIQYEQGQSYEAHTDCATPTAAAPLSSSGVAAAAAAAVKNSDVEEGKDFRHFAAWENHVPLRDKLNDRAATVLIYLTDADRNAGGETVFNELGVRVTPKRGRALIWSNLVDDDTAACDPRTRHRSLTVTHGTKMVYQKWYHQRPIVAIANRDMVRCDRSASCREYIYSKAVRDANYQTLLGVTHFQNKRWGNALASFEKALASDATHPQANIFASKLYRLQGRTERAVELVRTALRVTLGASSDAHQLLAELLWAQGDHEAAQQSYLNAMIADPLDVTPLVELAKRLLANGQRDEARVHLARAVEIDNDPYNPAAAML